MRRAFCILARGLAACSEPAPPPKPPPPPQAYFQDYMVSEQEQAQGFTLQNQIEPTRADPKRFFWRATYDGEGRVVTLETFAYPMCLQLSSSTWPTTARHPRRRSASGSRRATASPPETF